MRHQDIDINTWATTAHFKAKGIKEDVITDCTMPNEHRYMQCAAEKLLGKYRKLQYTPNERIVLVSGLGTADKMAQIRAICEHCIKNRINIQAR